MAAAVITALLDIGTRLPPARRAGWSDAVGVRMGGLRRRTVLVCAGDIRKRWTGDDSQDYHGRNQKSQKPPGCLRTCTVHRDTPFDLMLSSSGAGRAPRNGPTIRSPFVPHILTVGLVATANDGILGSVGVRLDIRPV